MACCLTCSMPTFEVNGATVCPHCDRRRHYMRDCPACIAAFEVDA